MRGWGFQTPILSRCVSTRGCPIRANTLLLCRGLPGSGKTTLAHTLAPSHAHAADDYFERDGGYHFDPSQLGEAHAQCQQRTEADMAAGVPVVAVHNTFTMAWEAEPYYAMAARHGYTVFVVEAQNNFGNVHGVPEAAVQRMRDRWERSLAPQGGQENS